MSNKILKIILGSGTLLISYVYGIFVLFPMVINSKMNLYGHESLTKLLFFFVALFSLSLMIFLIPAVVSWIVSLFRKEFPTKFFLYFSLSLLFISYMGMFIVYQTKDITKETINVVFINKSGEDIKSLTFKHGFKTTEVGKLSVNGYKNIDIVRTNDSSFFVIAVFENGYTVDTDIYFGSYYILNEIITKDGIETKSPFEN